MMRLNTDYTHISVEETVTETTMLTDPWRTVESRGFTAHLDGESTDGHHIEMSREGKTPDDALKNLFEAMSEADVTL